MLNTPSRPRFDLLRIPFLGNFLRWKHSRTAVQIPLFILAALMVVDGLLGSPLAAKNSATVAAWVHYRGFVVLALLLVGNLFCAACPFMLPRTLAKWLGRPTARWPRALRNKWLAVGALIAIVYCYELFDLWASPWWTAWLIVAYFAAAFVIEALFTRSSFCMYVCPLGTFNFLYSTVSPTKISARSLDVCRTCVGHDCINGNAAQQGCQLELYVPTLRSNLDCTLCLDCVKACPHDNVALAVRPPAQELFDRTWPRRLDLALLAVLATFLALVNAFAMTPPAYVLEAEIAAVLGTQREAIVLGLIFLVGAILLPLGLVYGAAAVSRRMGSGSDTLRDVILRYAYAFVPLGFAVWLAHYLFHFLTGMMTLVPAFQTFAADTLGTDLFGAPNWALAARFVPPVPVIQATQIAVMLIGGGVALAMAWRTPRAEGDMPRRTALPWLVLLTLVIVAAIYLFLLPMEMRGSALGG
ncbi:MAG: FesM [Caldilineaceae bacterium]|nr:FesM [Caldilineaceae bacterium]